MFRQSFNGWWSSIPPVTKNLIIINFLVWLLEICLPGFGNTLMRYAGLHYIGASDFNPAQIVTYMFMHSRTTLTHILFNMFTLWMFGRILEQVWGSKRFLIYYMVCGVGAAIVQEVVWALTWEHEYISGIALLNGLSYDNMREAVTMNMAHFQNGMEQYQNMLVTIGASGAVFGLLLGFAFVFPDMPMYLFFIPIPIKAKYMVLGYGVLEFFLGVTRSADTVAHFAHLGGLIFGLIILLYWRKKGILRGGYF